jgi:hypothetical protein
VDTTFITCRNAHFLPMVAQVLWWLCSMAATLVTQELSVVLPPVVVRP